MTNGTTIVIRRAIAVYHTLKQEVAEGNKVSVTNARDEVLKDILLP